MWHRCRLYVPCSLLCGGWQGGPARAPAAKIMGNQFGLGVKAGAGVAAGLVAGAGAAVGAEAGTDAGAVGGGGSGWPTGTIVTFFKSTGANGLSRPSRSTRVIVFTTKTEEGSH